MSACLNGDIFRPSGRSIKPPLCSANVFPLCLDSVIFERQVRVRARPISQVVCVCDLKSWACSPVGYIKCACVCVFELRGPQQLAYRNAESLLTTSRIQFTKSTLCVREHFISLAKYCSVSSKICSDSVFCKKKKEKDSIVLYFSRHR